MVQKKCSIARGISTGNEVIYQSREDGGEKFRRHKMLLRNDVQDEPAAETVEHLRPHLFITVGRIQHHSLHTQLSSALYSYY